MHPLCHILRCFPLWNVRCYMVLAEIKELTIKSNTWTILTATCPWLNQMASTTPSTALSRSAESKMTTGDLPPSSSDSFLPEPAVNRRRVCPTYGHNGHIQQSVSRNINVRTGKNWRKSGGQFSKTWDSRLCVHRKTRKWALMTQLRLGCLRYLDGLLWPWPLTYKIWSGRK